MPEVKKVGKNFVELAWAPPTSDGGSKILGYVVEKKLAGTDLWVKAIPYNVLDNNVTINDLPENGEVEFRVRAVNKSGEGEPSSSTGRVKITEFPSRIASLRLIVREKHTDVFRRTCTNIYEESIGCQCIDQWRSDIRHRIRF